jgi:hypothetical protein
MSLDGVEVEGLTCDDGNIRRYISIDWGLYEFKRRFAHADMA